MATSGRVRWAMAHVLAPLAMLVLSLGDGTYAGPRDVRTPRIEGPWWPVACNPTDHKYATGKQEVVDFAVWQAADGTWQLWSCIRSTRLKWAKP